MDTVMIFSDYAGVVVLWSGASIVALKTDNFDRRRESHLVSVLITRSTQDNHFEAAQVAFENIGYRLFDMPLNDKLILAYSRLVEMLKAGDDNKMDSV